MHKFLLCCPIYHNSDYKLKSNDCQILVICLENNARIHWRKEAVAAEARPQRKRRSRFTCWNTSFLERVYAETVRVSFPCFFTTLPVRYPATSAVLATFFLAFGRGSIPEAGPPLLDGGLAQLARAPALQAGGQRFESVILHFSDLWHIDECKSNDLNDVFTEVNVSCYAPARVAP